MRGASICLATKTVHAATRSLDPAQLIVFAHRQLRSLCVLACVSLCTRVTHFILTLFLCSLRTPFSRSLLTLFIVLSSAHCRVLTAFALLTVKVLFCE